jgi:hypothetical protein
MLNLIPVLATNMHQRKHIIICFLCRNNILHICITVEIPAMFQIMVKSITLIMATPVSTSQGQVQQYHPSP